MKGWGVLLGLLQVLVLLLLEEHWWYLGLEDPGKEEAKLRDQLTHTPWLLLLPMTDSASPVLGSHQWEGPGPHGTCLRYKNVREQDRCGVGQHPSAFSVHSCPTVAKVLGISSSNPGHPK